MKFIIDLIEDVREQIANQDTYIVTAGLLKIDENDNTKLNIVGEASINQTIFNGKTKELTFKIDNSDTQVSIGELIPSLLILDMDTMMYKLKIDANEQYSNMEVVGFGKNDEQKRYILFIKI
jgi:hypothetical protein